MGAPQTADAQLVGEACRFFDRLADLIDPRFYYDDEREPLNLRFMKKAARGAAKAALKESAKQGKRARLDPDAAVTTVELQRNRAEAKKAAAAGGGGAGGGAPAGGGGGGGGQPPDAQRGGAAEPGPGSARQQGQGFRLNISSGPAPSRDELLRRLHQRMEEARSQRNADDAGAGGGKQKAKAGRPPKSPADQAKAWRQQQLEKQLKGEGGAGAKRKAEGPPKGGQNQQQQGKKARTEGKQQQGQQGQPQQGQGQQQQQQQGSTMQLGRVVLDADKQQGGPGKHKKKPTKEALLKAAERRAPAKPGQPADDAAKARAAQAAWQAAMARASGEKVLDDPKLLRRSIKKDAQRKQRSTKKWQERMGAQQEAKQTRQDRRKDNLAARSKTKLDNKKAKREKKLLRAGFEGRKSGFISPGGGGGGGK
ncbi:hypothetical protein Rsub_07097 [Raphidocelis subcapitata]|uniref:Ribosomal RNA-processing protein 14/surfeit locus protein 6 C-terminal domain-containing protein n=1 Tax=Raphidocelis subcapitata TaxID=307507 RepID=A0A2V0P8C0_9CHLO|nr:hypothetical protein Rsub_07097 [Raphidocelis subcapitata]|eukprot:GBF94110.1 hypothetical protein Rsub_07097 [Raphidocelis subcapitata]